jgi:arsenite-transporting ATPase
MPKSGVLRLPPARLLFLAGKGGVGKTTVAASIGLQLARSNPRSNFTVISVDPAHALRDVFAAEAPPPNLAVEMIDTKAKWERFRAKLGEGIERAVDSLMPGGLSVAYDSEAMQRLVDIAPPGADELFAISRLSDLLADEEQRTVIVDTAPTGHFLRLLELPQSAGEWVREFMRLLLRYRELVPAGSLGEELVSASRALRSLDDALHSEAASVLVVTRPERMVVAESARLIAELGRRGVAVGAVIANAVTPESGCRCDRSMRSFEGELLARLAPSLAIERRDEPVTRLVDLEGLVPLA